MASSRSEENVNLNHFPTPNGVTVLDCPAILLGHVCFVLIGRCYCHYLFTKNLAGVIAIGFICG